MVARIIRRIAVSAAGVLVVAGLANAAAGRADATGRVQTVSGAARFQLNPDPNCASPLGICTTGSISGDLRGMIAGTGLSFVAPADPSVPSVGTFVNRTVISTDAGDLTCIEVGSANTAGDGEFVSLCEIVDAGGRLAGTTGYLTFRGTFQANAGGVYRYEGTLMRP